MKAPPASSDAMRGVDWGYGPGGPAGHTARPAEGQPGAAEPNRVSPCARMRANSCQQTIAPPAPSAAMTGAPWSPGSGATRAPPGDHCANASAGASARSIVARPKINRSIEARSISGPARQFAPDDTTWRPADGRPISGTVSHSAGVTPSSVLPLNRFGSEELVQGGRIRDDGYLGDAAGSHVGELIVEILETTRRNHGHAAIAQEDDRSPLLKMLVDVLREGLRSGVICGGRRA